MGFMVYAPKVVRTLEGKGLIAVRGGFHHSLALTQEGERAGTCPLPHVVALVLALGSV